MVAYLIKQLTGKVGIPIVTGYVLAGVVMGISLLRIFNQSILDRFEIVNDIALAIIGFSIGSELRKDVFKKLGKSIIIIAVFESIAAFLIVFMVVWIYDPGRVYLALILGAVSSATAPAATVYVIQQYKSRGPLTSTILAVVGIDDAVALMIFVFASVIAGGILRSEHISMFSILITPLVEITLSVLLGALLGLGFTLLFRRVRYPDDLLLGCSAFLLLCLGITQQFHLSGLLAVMSFGAVVANMNPMLTNRSGKILENISPLFFAYFFIFGGAHLDISLLPRVGILGLLYLVARLLGKMGGASLGALIGKAPAMVRKYIGFALIPQVGVAVALAILVRKEFGTGLYGPDGILLSTVVINVLLFTTVFTEIIGPLLTKTALTRAGERQDHIEEELGE